jgi:hypothetical protein
MSPLFAVIHEDGSTRHAFELRAMTRVKVATRAGDEYAFVAQSICGARKYERHGANEYGFNFVSLKPNCNRCRVLLYGRLKDAKSDVAYLSMMLGEEDQPKAGK